METIQEEDDKEVKMYERESMQAKQNINIDKKIDNQNKRESLPKVNNNENNEKDEYRESKVSQGINRYTQVNESLFNAVESYQEEMQKELNIDEDENNKQENDNNNINNEKSNENNNITTPKPKREKIKEYKVIVLGDYGVGKTSLIYRYLNNKFKKELEEGSIKSEKNLKVIQIDENIRIKINIWDTAGQEKSGKIFKKYYIDAYGALIVFDLTNKESFNNLKNWINELKTNSPSDIVFCFAANKSDLDTERKISYEEIKNVLKDNLYYEVSSKNGNNVSLAFEQLAYNIIEKEIEEKDNPDKVLRGLEGRKTKDLNDVYNEKDLKPKKVCC